MFFEPHSKVLSVFVETLVDFVSVHAADLAPWLPLLLPRLFIKLTSDLRSSTPKSSSRFAPSGSSLISSAACI